MITYVIIKKRHRKGYNYFNVPVLGYLILCSYMSEIVVSVIAVQFQQFHISYFSFGTLFFFQIFYSSRIFSSLGLPFQFSICISCSTACCAALLSWHTTFLCSVISTFSLFFQHDFRFSRFYLLFFSFQLSLLYCNFMLLYFFLFYHCTQSSFVFMQSFFFSYIFYLFCIVS